MNPFEKYVKESLEMLSERSINKIQKDFNETVDTMVKKAADYKEAEGDAKDAILAELKELTLKKKELAKELDAAVAGKDKNVQLVLTEAKKFYNTKEIAKMSNAAGDIVVDAKYAIQDLGVAYGDKVPAKELNKVLTEYDLEIEDLTESTITEGKKVTLKRRYTENHPAVTAGKHAKIRNKVLEFIKDGRISAEAFENFVASLSNNSKRWARNNSKYFTISEEGVSLSKFGQRILKSITVNEKTEKNPEVWVPGGFDKEIGKYPNSKITRDIVLKAAKKWDVDEDDAIAYVEYGWNLDLNENKTNMKTQFIYESFSEFVNSLNESTVNENDAKVIVNAFTDYHKKRDEVTADDWEQFIYDWTVMGDGGDELESSEIEWDTVDDVLTMLDKKGYKKIDHEGIIELYENTLNEAFASQKLASLLTGGAHMDKDLPKAFYQMSKLKLDQIQDVDIIEMDPKEAKKEKRANAVYFYFTTNAKENPYAGKSAWREEKQIPANTLLAITNGQNEWMATEWQRTFRRSEKSTRTLKVGKREDGAGFKKSGRGEYNSGISSMKQVSELADRAYVLDLDILKARYSATTQRDERAAAKKGAIAFKNDKDFKAENLARYNEIIANKASKLPIDKIVKDAIDKMSEQIKDALDKGEKGRYGDIIVGTSDKGREAKLSDAANHMQRILDDYQRYVSYVKQAEEEEKAGYGSSYYAREVKNYAKNVTDKVKQIEGFSYAW